MGKVIQLKNKTQFKIRNRSTTEAEIVIYSDIGDSFWGDSVSAASFSAELKELPDTVKNISVRLNSPGGDVFDGVSIYNRLKHHPAKVTVYIDGLAASIASIIALAGDEIIMGEGALMMIHRPMSMAFGNATAFEEMIQRLDDVEEQLVGIYKRRTGKDRTEIKNALAKETWFDAKEAIEFGLADSMMEADETIDIAASLKRATWIKNKPTARCTKDIVRKQIGSFKKDIEDFLAR